MKQWTREEENTLLKMNSQSLTHVEIAEALKRSYSSISCKIRTIKQPRNRHIWTKEDEQFLKEHYNKTTRYQLAKHLNAPVSSVATKLVTLNLHKETSLAQVSQNIGRQVILKKGWEILSEGTGNTSYDFIVNTPKGKFVVNVKNCNSIAGIDPHNIERLVETELPVLFLIIHNHKVFCLKLKEVWSYGIA
jgi:hypothetical protein